MYGTSCSLPLQLQKVFRGIYRKNIYYVYLGNI